MGLLSVRCVLCAYPREIFFGDGRCARCQRLFLPCPALCPRCAQPHSGNDCVLNWQNTRVRVGSVSALYLAVGKTYELLKQIKKKSGREIPRLGDWLRADLRRAAWLLPLRDAIARANNPFICEIPQSPERRLQFAAPIVPLWGKLVGNELRIPRVELLLPRAGFSRQGTLHAAERRKMIDRFSLSPRIDTSAVKGRTLLLLEDFMTTGSTLHAALRTIEPLEPTEIHILLLGFRPRL